MKKLLFTIFIAILLLSFGCDTYQASFEDSIPLHTLTTNVSPEEGGTVHPTGGEFNSGDGIEIEARPAEGYIFDRWEDDLTGNTNPDLLLFNSSRTVTAHFVKLEHRLNVEVIGEGTVRESVVSSEEQSDSLDSSVPRIKLTAESENGWLFDRWEGDLSGSENPETIILDEEKNVTAIFNQEIPEVNPSNSSVSANPTDLKVGENSTVSVELRDDNDNSINGLSEEDFEIELSGNASAGSIQELPEAGMYEFEVTSNTIGDVRVSVTANEITLDDTSVITFDVGDPHELVIVIQPENTQSGQPVEGPPTVQVFDEFGHEISGVNVSVREQGGREFSSGELVVTTDELGFAEFNNLVIHSNINWFTLVFSVEGVVEIVSDRFRVSVFERSTAED
ncbi:hypothetical protein BH23BAC3_BH23BAC3_16530 [soil metagenome]